MSSGPDQRRKPPCGQASRRFDAGSMRAGHALAAFGNQSAQTWRRSQKPEKHSNAANTRKRKEAQPSPSPVLLRFQEQIKGPKNAPIARFDGLRCYQSRSEIGNGFWARAAKAVLQMGFRQVLNTSARIRRGPGHALAAFRHQPARTWRRSQKPEKHSNAANTRKRKEAQPSPSPVSLQFQEQIKGPKNAPIARFDGLRCYQTSSETSDVFRAGSAAKTALRTGFKKVRCRFNAGRACTGCFRKPVRPDLAAESEARKAFKCRKHAKAQGSAAQPKPRSAPVSGANKRPEKRPHRTV